MDKALLRNIPKVDELLAPVRALCPNASSAAVTAAVRRTLDTLREDILSGAARELPERDVLCALAADAVRRAEMPSLRPVINATGVVLHTNLGRARLSGRAAKAAADAAEHYSTLEYDVESGGRGSRNAHVEKLLCQLTGAESALVVNNNAAAVLLLLTALTAGGEVVVSRGELVEIGGSFRVPEIMSACGATLREVGTTNKTRAADYAAAIGEHTRALMKVHTSNYRIVGFTESASREELAALAHSRGLPFFEDLGSGSLFDLEAFGIHGEPTLQGSVRAGTDAVTCSGDKLLGGPQAGILVGKKSCLDVLKRHPLLRALRVDKMTLAALEAMRTEIPERREGTFVPAERIKNPTEPPRFTASIYRAGQLTDALVNEGVETVYVPLELLPSVEVEKYRGRTKFAAVLPRVWRTADEEGLREQLRTAKERGVECAVLGNLGHFALVRGLDMELRGDFGLNVFNSAALRFLKEQGLSGATLSFELRHEQLRDISKCIPCEAIVYGRLPLMITENCIVANEFGCRHFKGRCGALCADSACAGAPELTDRVGERFPVLHAYGCRSELQNGKTLWLADKPEYRKIGLTYARLRFTTESAEECVRVLRAYKGREEYTPKDITRGLFYRGVE